MKSLKNQNGLGLVELMVGIAVMGVVMTSLMYVIHSSMVMQGKALAMQEAVGVIDETRIILSGGTSCQAALIDNTFDLAQAQSKTGFKFKLKMFNGTLLADGEKQGPSLRADQFRLRGAAALGPDADGKQRYFARVSGAFSPISGPFAGKASERLIASVVLTVDGSNKVTRCSVTTANDPSEALAAKSASSTSCYSQLYDDREAHLWGSSLSHVRALNGAVINGKAETNGMLPEGSVTREPSAVCVNGAWIGLYSPTTADQHGGDGAGAGNN